MISEIFGNRKVKLVFEDQARGVAKEKGILIGGVQLKGNWEKMADIFVKMLEEKFKSVDLKGEIKINKEEKSWDCIERSQKSIFLIKQQKLETGEEIFTSQPDFEEYKTISIDAQGNEKVIDEPEDQCR